MKFHMLFHKLKHVWGTEERLWGIKDDPEGKLSGLSWVLLLEVLLCLLQPPQSAQQHASLHHRAGIGLRGRVSQVILHKHSDGKSPLICTPKDTSSYNSAVHETRTKRVTNLSLHVYNLLEYSPVCVRAPCVANRRRPTERRAAVLRAILYNAPSPSEVHSVLIVCLTLICWPNTLHQPHTHETEAPVFACGNQSLANVWFMNGETLLSLEWLNRHLVD